MKKPNTEGTKKLDAFRQEVKQKAEDHINNIMPAKVVELSKLIDEAAVFKSDPKVATEALAWADASTSEEGPRKKRKLNGDAPQDATSNVTPKFLDVVPCNKELKDFHMNVLKPEVYAAIECANAVKVWIQLNIPRIEDGNNFGVEVQQEALEEFTRAENNGLAVLDQMMKYYCTRAKLTSKILKYPNVEDYRQAIIELDMKEMLTTKICMMDIRNCYATLYDVVMKNYEKLNQPRSGSHANQFY